MGWFWSYALASLGIGFVVMRIVEFLLGGIAGSLMVAIKPAAFVSSWSAMTTYGGMRKVSGMARRVRGRTESIRNLIDKEGR